MIKLIDAKLFKDFSEPPSQQYNFSKVITRRKSRDTAKPWQGLPVVWRNPPNWISSANEIIRMWKCSSQETVGQVFYSCGTANPKSAAHSGTNTVFTNVCGTKEICKQGTLDVHLCSRGTLHMDEAHCGLVLDLHVPCCRSVSSLFLLLLNKINFEKLYRCNEGQKNLKPLCVSQLNHIP